jgi:CheY-like chemotaxis protein
MYETVGKVLKPVVVLVVEDEMFQRMQAVTLIEEAGYDVVEAGNADEAIAILEERKDIRIVFTDIEMPGSMMGSSSPARYAIAGRPSNSS